MKDPHYIAHVKREYSPEELQHLFVNRLDDGLFRRIANADAKRPFLDDDGKVWQGYEIATDSRYLNAR